MEGPMTFLRQYKIQIAIAIQIAHADVGRSFGGLLNIDCERELASGHGNLNRDEAACDSAKDHSSYRIINGLHRLVIERCSKPLIIICHRDFQSNYDPASDEVSSLPHYC